MMETMTDILTLTLAGAIGTVAFGVIYHISPKHLWAAFSGGALTTCVLLAMLQVSNGNNLVSNAVAAFAGGVYCTVCAYWRKAPAPIFMIPALFPLVPGRALYYAMASWMLHDRVEFTNYFVAAAEISFGIAVGMMFATLVCNVFIKRASVPRARRRRLWRRAMKG